MIFRYIEAALTWLLDIWKSWTPDQTSNSVWLKYLGQNEDLLEKPGFTTLALV